MSFWRTLWQNKKSRFGGGCLMLFFLMGGAGPLVVELETRADLSRRFQPPSTAHPLGTDYAGRDISAQIVHGSSDVLLIAFSAAFFGTGLALFFGFVAGWRGGRVDVWLMQFADVILTLPRFALMAIAAGMLHMTIRSASV